MEQNEYFGCSRATWDVKKLNFLGENPGSCVIKLQKFSRNFQTNWKMNE